jgi:hypothetical protein
MTSHTKTGRAETRTRTVYAVSDAVASALGRPAQEHKIVEIWEEVHSQDFSGWKNGPSFKGTGWRRISFERVL